MKDEIVCIVGLGYVKLFYKQKHLLRNTSLYKRSLTGAKEIR